MRNPSTIATAGVIALASTAWSQSETPEPSFVTCDALLDAKIVSPGDAEHTADITDVVVDARDGRALYAIVDTNGILGVPDRNIAVPYGSLTWNPETSRFTIDATAEELSTLPECNPGDLTELAKSSWLSTLRGVYGDRPELTEVEDMRADEYTRLFAVNVRPKTLNGKIAAINRQATTAMGGTCYAIVIQEENADRLVTAFLAPAAYLTREGVLPSAGEPVSITAVEGFDAEGASVFIAKTIRLQGDAVRLRDEAGVPTWPSSDLRSGGMFLMLAGSMDDGDMRARGEAFGGIDEVIFEAHSGTAAFAVISVGGLLGVDDTLYPVPCAALVPGRASAVFIDMPVEKLKLAPKLSGDGVKDLGDEQFAGTVYAYYQVEPKPFDFDRARTWTTRGGNGAGN